MSFRPVVLAILLSAAQATTAESAIVVLNTTGEVMMSTSSHGPWKPIGQRKSLEAAVALKTTAASSIDIVFNDGSRIRVPENSTVKIDKAGKADEEFFVQLDVITGRVLCVAARQSPKAKFEVKTTFSVCGVWADGTAFEATHDGRFRCEKGKLICVYVAFHLVPPTNIGSGEQTAPAPAEDIDVFRKGQIPREELNALSKELDTLKGPGAG